MKGQVSYKVQICISTTGCKCHIVKETLNMELSKAPLPWVFFLGPYRSDTKLVVSRRTGGVGGRWKEEGEKEKKTAVQEEG